MNKLLNLYRKRWSYFKVDHILLVALLILDILMCIPSLFPPRVHICQFFLSAVQISGISLVIILNYIKVIPFDKLYYFVIAFIGLFGLDLILRLHFLHFDEVMKTGFILYTLMAPWYMRSSKDLQIFQMAVGLAVIFLVLIHSHLLVDDISFPITVLFINIFIYFILDSQLKKTFLLTENKLRYGSIIEKLNDGILQLDEQGMIIMVNQKFCSIIGYKKEELVGKMNISSMISKKNRRVLVNHLRDRKDEKGGTYEIKFTHRNGKPLWLFLSITTQFDQLDKLKGSIAIVSDITKKKQAAKELKKYSTNLQKTNQALETANIELERFTQISATDLKAPLTSIKQTISDIQQACDVGEYEKGASMIPRLMGGSKRMRGLLNALSQYARSSSHNLETQKVNVEDVIRKLITFSWIKPPENIHVGELPLINCNLWQIERLFYHLIDNALKFSKDDEPLTINISAKIDDDEEVATFCLADNGLGISKEYHEHIFLIFQKGPYQNQNGMGLGLPICKKIVENHKGRIYIKSKLGKGAKVYFSLPLYKKEEEEPLLS